MLFSCNDAVASSPCLWRIFSYRRSTSDELDGSEGTKIVARMDSLLSSGEVLGSGTGLQLWNDDWFPFSRGLLPLEGADSITSKDLWLRMDTDSREIMDVSSMSDVGG